MTRRVVERQARPGSAREPRAPKKPAAAVGELLELVALQSDGLAALADGTLLRALQVTPVNPLVMDPARAEQVSAAFTQLAARIPEQQSLQLYVQAAPLPLEHILRAEQDKTNRAAHAARVRGEDGRAEAISRLGYAATHSIRTDAPAIAAMQLSYTVLIPWTPPTGPTLRRAKTTEPVGRTARVLQRAVRDVDRLAEQVRTELEAMDLRARPLDGRELAELLWARTAPTHAAEGIRAPVDGLLEPLEQATTPEQATARARALQAALCPEPVDFTDRSVLRIGGSAEQVSYVSSVPDHTWLGWLLHFMQVPKPFALAVHIHALDRHRQRSHHRRRYKRIYGVNRGTEMRGKPVDPEAAEREREAQEINQELAVSAGSGIFEISIYLALRDPAGNTEELADHVAALGREVVTATDARLAGGLFAQRDLYRSSLPLGRDVARRVRKYVSRNVGDTVPLVGTGCGSPDGVPLGYAHPGRTLERLDPFDPAHDNHLMVVNGKSGSGKTMALNLILARCLAQGATGAVIDRAGHYEYLCSLIPGARSLRLGHRDGAHAINPWDVEDVGRVDAEKVDYLLALHSLLIGAHQATDDSYGLSSLESNLLGLAIRAVYDRSARFGEHPRELLLQEELYRRAEEERADGSAEISAVLRTLAERLHNYVQEGTYAYLTDRPTTVPREAPLVAFDTRAIPDQLAGAALFVVCEHVTRRVERARERHLTHGADGSPWAGRSFLVVDEAWKLIERRATGRWINELARRSRHLALFMVGISQQLTDFTKHPEGQALLSQSSIQLFLRQSADQLEAAREALKLSGEEIHAISQLATAKRKYSTAFLCNGTRGRGTVSIQAGAVEYWIATSDPENDEPVRRAALREAGGDPWAALALLADPAWHTNHEQHRTTPSAANGAAPVGAPA